MDEHFSLALVPGNLEIGVLVALGYLTEPHAAEARELIIPTISVADVLCTHALRWKDEFKTIKFSNTQYFTTGQERALVRLEQLGLRSPIMPWSEFTITIADATRAVFHQAAENLYGEGARVDPDPFTHNIWKIFDGTYNTYPFLRGFSTMLTRFTATALSLPYQPQTVRQFAQLLVLPKEFMPTSSSQREGGLMSIFRRKES